MNPVDLTAQIVCAYLAGNDLGETALPDLIRLVHEALTNPVAPKPEPAILPHESIFRDHLVCMEDGLCFKLLTRHLITVHSMMPNEYRAKWGLPRDYPMIAPGYAKQRSEIAKDTGLGKKR